MSSPIVSNAAVVSAEVFELLFEQPGTLRFPMQKNNGLSGTGSFVENVAGIYINDGHYNLLRGSRSSPMEKRYQRATPLK
jgi:hypothetical protein